MCGRPWMLRAAIAKQRDGHEAVVVRNSDGSIAGQVLNSVVVDVLLKYQSFWRVRRREVEGWVHAQHIGIIDVDDYQGVLQRTAIAQHPGSDPHVEVRASDGDLVDHILNGSKVIVVRYWLDKAYIIQRGIEGWARSWNFIIPSIPVGKPTNESCWRFSFRSKQGECKRTSGFMLQIQEHEGLGLGQKIESDMAKLEDLKTFRVHQGMVRLEGKNCPREFDATDAQHVAKEVREWHNTAEGDTTLWSIYLRHTTKGGAVMRKTELV